MHSHDQHTHRLLTEIEASDRISQRSLARRLGIALGLTNLLLRRLIRKGWVRVIHIRSNRVRYLITPRGIAEKARMSRDSLRYSVHFYVDARDRIGKRFATLSNDWPVTGGRNEKRIIFLGTGEVAEIGYICLQETDLQLVGVIDDQGRKRFFDVPVYTPSDVRGRHARGTPFDQLVVMAFDRFDHTMAILKAAQVPHECVHWL